jgi:exodeoxyribonuclease-3
VWLERLRGELVRRRTVERPALVAGDFNVAPTDEDIYDPRRWRRRTHASPPERAAVAALVDLGFVDLGAPDHAFTWWNYRTPVARDMGLRIDLALASPALAARVESVTVDRAARTVDRPSDHAPLVIDLDGRSD